MNIPNTMKMKAASLRLSNFSDATGPAAGGGRVAHRRALSKPERAQNASAEPRQG